MKLAAKKTDAGSSRISLGAGGKSDRLFPSSPAANQVFSGDCLDVLRALNVRHAGNFIDLIYIAPPFNSKRNYNRFIESGDGERAQEIAFRDTWARVDYERELEDIGRKSREIAGFIRSHKESFRDRASASYLTTMAARVMEMHRALKDTGSFYLHCDPTMSHSLKLLCDLIFGRKNFRNEVVWHYSGGVRGKKQWARQHDCILFYTKGGEWTFNADAVLVPFQSKMTEWRHKKGGQRGKPMPKGKPDDVFQINMLNTMSKERVGYPTQKPLDLLERIVAGDLVADFFGGCGTTVVAAQKLGRRWIACDISESAVGLLEKRLRKEANDKAKYEVVGFPVDAKGAKRLARDNPLRFQDWVVRCLLGGEPNPRRVADGGYDGHLRVGLGRDESGKEKTGTCLIEVKGGGANVGMVRAFATAVRDRRAEMGVFVCFREKCTPGMADEAAAQGSAAPRVPFLQIRTVEDLLDGDRPRYPLGPLLDGLGG